MFKTRFPLTRRALCALLLGAALPAAMAAYPDKPIRLIVPAPPGGTLDVVARALSEQLSIDLGQPVVIDNRPGGAGAIGVQALKSAPTDGYTVFMLTSGILTESPHVMKLPFDPLKDVVPVVALTRGSLVLVGDPKLPANNLKELIAYVKANPGKFSIASYSPGTIGHFASVLLNQRAGTDLAFVPFSGSPPALQQVMGGQIALMFDGLATSRPFIESGRVKAFGVPGNVRSPQLPNVPTFAEQGYPELIEPFKSWQGVAVAPGVPAETVAKLRAAVLRAAAKPAVRDKLTGMGMELADEASLEELQRTVRADYERNGAIVQKFKISLNP
jgi:tripartite-type tricarboxylate transporter receptor subunit TctC